jgi:hypothetical protein
VSRFADAATAARGALRHVFGELIDYKRGSDTISGITAMVSRQDVVVESDTGVYTRKVMDEITVLASDLDFGSGAVDPARGDIVTDAEAVSYRVANEEVEYLRDTAEWRIPVVMVE